MSDHTHKWYIPFWKPNPERIRCTVCRISLKDDIAALEAARPRQLYDDIPNLNRKAALWDSIGASAVELLRDAVDEIPINDDYADRFVERIRALLARAEQQEVALR